MDKIATSRSCIFGEKRLTEPVAEGMQWSMDNKLSTKSEQSPQSWIFDVIHRQSSFCGNLGARTVQQFLNNTTTTRMYRNEEVQITQG